MTERRVKRGAQSPDLIHLPGGRRIYPAPGGTCTIATNAHGWLPGIYDGQETATAAFDCDVADLEVLSQRVCRIEGENRAITMADLEAQPR